MIYVLKRLDSTYYDQTIGVVVRASNHGQARRLASEKAGEEGPETWLDRTLTSCKQVGPDGAPEVILTDVWNG